MEGYLSSIRKWLGTGSINIFGLPFSGKDTHGHKLAKQLKAELISGGDILRSSHGPKHIQEHIAKGNLAPTDEYLSIVLPFLSQSRLQNKPLILSSVGRWHGEEESVIKAAEESGHPIKAIIYLSVDEKESERRWHIAERGREDDMEHHILLNRFREFRQKTLPVLEYYLKIGLLIEIDAMPAEPEVTDKIIEELAKLNRS